MIEKNKKTLSKVLFFVVIFLTIGTTVYLTSDIYDKIRIERYQKEDEAKRIQREKEVDSRKKWKIYKVFDNLYNRDTINISVLNKECTFQDQIRFNGKCSNFNIELKSDGRLNTNIDLHVFDGHIIKEVEFKLGKHKATSFKNNKDSFLFCSNYDIEQECSIIFPYRQDFLIKAIEESEELIVKITYQNCSDESLSVVQHEYDIRDLKLIDQIIKIKTVEYAEEDKIKKSFLEHTYN